MPIAPKFHIEDMYDLALQMKRAPESVRKKQIQAAEDLLVDIEEETIYPLDYIVYRITKYRGDEIEQPMLAGNALTGDLVSLIAIVSRTLDIDAEGMLTVADAATKLRVSPRTISRLRKDGLVFYWVVEPDKRRRLGCTDEMLQSFMKRKKERLTSASRFSRLSAEEKRWIVDAALQYRGFGRSLNDVAVELSKKTGRGQETIRELLHGDEQAHALLHHPPPLSKHDAKVVERARRMGVSWEKITSKYKRSRDALRKAVARQRATRLKQLEVLHIELDVFQRNDAQEVILGSPIVLNVPPPLLTIDPLTFGRYSIAQSTSEEIAIVSAMHLLRKRANSHIKTLGYSPKVSSVNQIENDLYWSFLLQQQLMLNAFPPSLAVAVQHAGRPLHELPSGKILSLVQQVIVVVGDVCGMLDPSKGQNTAKTPASVLDRALSSLDISQTKDVAAARQKAPFIRCPFHNVVPWSYLIPTMQEKTA
jgi:hypothetical protein